MLAAASHNQKRPQSPPQRVLLLSQAATNRIKMEESDVCPLCCEELDISDRQFFPCKCGYQVCMWCWHRIRESESGLCPACRTPYGDDPHEFSAVDMEEVLKANKAKAAAEKRERERLREEDGGGIASIGPMALPKDRNQLANMRVIRRNLVYAVGLPPAVATEENLRKPEYFGQYGKISKIVLNRNNNNTTSGGDPRRASASAYVTFVHKEDTLACILALDGYYIDGRNIRASYGTSKYCSAFIKNVRCNNPECTYLHCMGDAEDTFTKQEIQAGYVTSGRDVLARQQQIVAQALSAAAGGSNGGGTKRKTGHGGPSGTGKHANVPLFPPPTYDEAIKSSSSHSRSGSSGGGGYSAVSTSSSAAAATAVGTTKLGRSISLGAPTGGTTAIGGLSGAAPAKGAIGSVGVAAASSGFATRSKSVIGTTGSSVSAMASVASTSAVPVIGSTATAASVVAGVRNSSSAVPEASHTTLTQLTPLKRSSAVPAKGATGGVAGVKSSSGGENGLDSVQMPPNMPVPKGLSAEQKAALLEQRREAMVAMARQQREMALKLSALRNGAGQKQNGTTAVGPLGTAPTSPSSSISSASGAPVATAKLPAAGHDIGVGSIGGTAIGAVGSSNPVVPGPIGESMGGGLGSLGGQPIGDIGTARSSSLGGEIYTGQLPSKAASVGGKGSDKWNSMPANSSGGLFGNSGSLSGGIWGGDSSGPSGGLETGFPPSGVRNAAPGVIGGGGKAVGAIGSHGPIGGGNVIGGTRYNNSGSSALASMLGINLPTGSDSLRESSSLWESSTTPAPIGNSGHGVIGGGSGVIGSKGSTSAPIGGYAIGAGGLGNSVAPNNNPVDGNSNSNSDIALLQSLLPGVHITSGTAQQPAAPTTTTGGGFGAVGGSGWDSGTPGFSQQDTWGGQGGGMQQPVGGLGSSQQNQKQNQSSIW